LSNFLASFLLSVTDADKQKKVQQQIENDKILAEQEQLKEYQKNEDFNDYKQMSKDEVNDLCYKIMNEGIDIFLRNASKLNIQYTAAAKFAAIEKCKKLMLEFLKSKNIKV
jgi:hypothetical protein